MLRATEQALLCLITRPVPTSWTVLSYVKRAALEKQDTYPQLLSSMNSVDNQSLAWPTSHISSPTRLSTSLTTVLGQMEEPAPHAHTLDWEALKGSTV